MATSGGKGGLGDLLEIIGKGVGAVLPPDACFVVVVWRNGPGTASCAQFVANVEDHGELLAGLRAATESLEAGT